MNLQTIKNYCENRAGGLKQLASEVGMSEANLHRCIRLNKIQASDLETIAHLLGVDIREFFDEVPGVTAVNSAVATGNGTANNSVNITTAPSGYSALLAERVRSLETLIIEKNERINELKERIEELKAK